MRCLLNPSSIDCTSYWRTMARLLPNWVLGLKPKVLLELAHFQVLAANSNNCMSLDQDFGISIEVDLGFLA